MSVQTGEELRRRMLEMLEMHPPLRGLPEMLFRDMLDSVDFLEERVRSLQETPGEFVARMGRKQKS